MRQLNGPPFNQLLHVLVLHPLLFPYRGGRVQALYSEYNIDQADFADWILFLPSNLKRRLGHLIETLNDPNEVCECIIALLTLLNESKEKIEQVVSLVLGKLAKKDI